MNVTWIVDTMGMVENSNVHNYVNAIKKTGASVIEVKHVPFSDTPIEIDVSGPIVLYGSVGFISLMRKNDKYQTGIFGDDETFTYKNWANKYGDMLLNSTDSTELMTISDFAKMDRNSNDFIFVRPQHDTKSLVGQVLPAGEFKEWCLIAEKGLFAGVNSQTPIVIGKPYGIEAEWRLFIVDDQVVCGSQYRKKGKLFKSPDIPQDVLDFAKKAITKWSPALAYTLDICKSAGNYYIVEAQGFNSAGQYAADVEKLVSAVNSVVIK